MDFDVDDSWELEAPTGDASPASESGEPAPPVAPLRLGLIGVGRVALVKHLPDCERSARVELVALSSRSAERREQAAREFHVATRYASWRQLLDHEGLEAVIVATPNATHAGIVQAALERGFSVLCEKPLCCYAVDAEPLVDLARRRRLTLAVAHHLRFHPAMRWLAAHRGPDGASSTRLIEIALKNAGPRHLPRAQNWFLDPRQSGGGCWLDLGVHALDLLDLLGYSVNRVLECRLAGTQWSSEVEDEAVVRLELAGGGEARLECAWTAPEPVKSVRIQDQRGLWRAECACAALVGAPEGAMVAPFDSDAGAGNLVEAFALAARADDGEIVSGEAALRHLRIIEAGYACAKRGAPVEISDAGPAAAASAAPTQADAWAVVQNWCGHLGMVDPIRLVHRLKELHAWHQKRARVQNLTRMLDDEGFALGQCADSLALVTAVPRLLTRRTRVLDLGTGGGFPGVVLALALPFCEVTLLDRTQKKAEACLELLEALSCEAEVLGMPFEVFVSTPETPRFDLITLRAVEKPERLLPLLHRALAPGGRIALYRGLDPGSDAPLLAVWKKSRLQAPRTVSVQVPTLDGTRPRRLLVAKAHGHAASRSERGD